MAKKAEDKDPDVKPIATNRRASFDYELGSRYEAGMVLIGSEVKSLRLGSANLTDAWISLRDGEAFVEGLRIPVLTHAAFGHAENRARKLLLHEREIVELKAEIERKGMTVIATRLYFRKGRVKLEIAVAKGRRQGDKREAIKTKDAEREAKAAIDLARKKGLHG